MSQPNGSLLIKTDGSIWWVPADGDAQCLANADSLCGAGILRTTPDDPFRDCCTWHDRAYQMRSFFERRGWNRKCIDDYFLVLMKNRAGTDKLLVTRATTYYNIVRLVGWIFYYRHSGYTCSTKPKYSRNDECKELIQTIIKECENGN